MKGKLGGQFTMEYVFKNAGHRIQSSPVEYLIKLPDQKTSYFVVNWNNLLKRQGNKFINNFVRLPKHAEQLYEPNINLNYLSNIIV